MVKYPTNDNFALRVLTAAPKEPEVRIAFIEEALRLRHTGLTRDEVMHQLTKHADG